MLNNGIYKMSDYDNQETLFKIKESEKSITFELMGEIPRFTRGDMDMFIHNKDTTKKQLQKNQDADIQYTLLIKIDLFYIHIKVETLICFNI